MPKQNKVDKVPGSDDKSRTNSVNHYLALRIEFGSELLLCLVVKSSEKIDKKIVLTILRLLKRSMVQNSERRRESVVDVQEQLRITVPPYKNK